MCDCENLECSCSNCMKVLHVCYAPAHTQGHHDDVDCHKSLELGNDGHWLQKD